MRAHWHLAWVIVALAALLPACGTTTVIRPHTGGAETAAAIQSLERQSAIRTARLLLVGAAPRSVIGLRVEGDSVTWLNRGRVESVALTDVARVEIVDRKRGAGEGLLYGALAGVLGGAAIGLAFYDGPGIIVGSRAENAILVSVLFSAASIPIGVAVGMAEGHRDVFLVCPAPQAAGASTSGTRRTESGCR